MDFSSFNTKQPILKYQAKIMWEKQSCNEDALSKKLLFYFLGTILAPYDPEVLVWVIWHQNQR